MSEVTFLRWSLAQMISLRTVCHQRIQLRFDPSKLCLDWFRLRPARFGATKKEVMVVVKTPMNPIPTIIKATAISRPSPVTGETSPYPTVVVTTAHHSASPTD